MLIHKSRNRARKLTDVMTNAQGQFDKSTYMSFCNIPGSSNANHVNISIPIVSFFKTKLQTSN